MPQEQQEQLQSKPEPGSSIRYKTFYSALELASQSAASKWTYEDFQECFPTYCEEFPIKAQTLRTQMAQHILEATRQRSDQLLADHDVAVATDVLHEIVLEARAKKQAGQYLDIKDVWTPTLEPRAAVQARTIPVLESERDHILAMLDKLGAENEDLISELATNASTKREYDNQVTKKLEALDEMATSFEGLPLQDMGQWAMDAAESLGSRG